MGQTHVLPKVDKERPKKQKNENRPEAECIVSVPIDQFRRLFRKVQSSSGDWWTQTQGWKVVPHAPRQLHHDDVRRLNISFPRPLSSHAT